MSSSLPEPALRVAFQQTSLPRYRLPIFRQLAAVPGRALRLHYGSEAPALANVDPEGFAGSFEPFFRLPKMLGQLFFWHQTQWRLASRKRADVAIMCWNTRFLSLIPALIRARLTGVPVALWGHGFSKRASSWRSFLRNLPARLASAVIVYDGQTAERLVASGLPAEKVFVAPNGLDTRSIQAARADALALADRVAWRQAKGFGAAPVLVFLGRLFADNRLDVAIDAIGLLARQYPALRLVVIGSGAEEQARLEAHAEQAQVADHLVWVGPVYQEQELAPWMIAADVFVYPSNVGLSLIHAFNYALPGVVCEPLSAHNPEIVALVNGVNGTVAGSLDADALAAALEPLLADQALRQRMGEAALACVQQTFNEQSMVSGFNALIDYLDQQRSAR